MERISTLALWAALTCTVPVCATAPIGTLSNLEMGSTTPNGFEENKGQVRTTSGDTAPFVRYRLSQGNTSIFLLENGIAYQFNRLHYPERYESLAKDARHDHQKHMELDALGEQVRLETYRMDMLLEGANSNPRISTEGRSTDYTQYYNHDALDVRTYTKVTYHEVWPGIDWVVYTTDKGMKYDFVVHPGADPDQIRLRFKDHEELYVDDEGNLIHGNRMGRFTEERPVSFQGGHEVPTQFNLEGGLLHFELDGHDRSLPLTIDPDRIWGTYYGGEGNEDGVSCSADADDNIFLAGTTGSIGGIADSGHQNTPNVFADSFLVKFNSNGVRLWATYYGGEGQDLGQSCTAGLNGSVYLGGITTSLNAIASLGHQSTHGGGDWDAFLVEFDSDGTRIWSTYYGGSGSEYRTGTPGLSVSCVADGIGNVYLVGTTNSMVSIASNGHQNTFGGGAWDAFLVKFNGNGERLWGSYYGGAEDDINGWSGDDQGYSCAIGENGSVYMAGATHSNTSIASGGHQNTHGGPFLPDGFLVKFNSNGQRIWGTYYGGDGYDYGICCTVDAANNVFLAGMAQSTTAIASAGHQNVHGGGSEDGYLVKFNSSGQRVWGTYFGGEGWDEGRSCTTDVQGNVYLAGVISGSSTTNLSYLGFQSTHGGGAFDAFLVKYTTYGERQWCTYYGGGGWDESWCVLTLTSGSVLLAGWTDEPGSTLAENGHQNSPGGGYGDAFLVKFEGVVVGIGEQQKSMAFRLQPNPTNGITTLSTQRIRPVQVTLFDAAGRAVLENPITNIHSPIIIDLSSHENGLYLLQVLFTDGTQAVERVVKE